jgi:hypothetical protein
MEVKKSFEPITDRYGNELIRPDEKPTFDQALDSWALVNELLKLGYPHNFQYEEPHISNYLFDLSALIDKTLKIKRSGDNDKR